jgi:hypothetical protein
MRNDSIAVRTKERLLSLLGIESSLNKENTNNLVEKLKRPGQFSNVEEQLLRSSINNTQSHSIDNLKHDMLAISTDVNKKIDHNKSFQSMVPEIGKAKTVLVPSILSPSDMFSNYVTCDLDTDKLDEVTKSKIIEIINVRMNDRLKIGNLLSEWIGDALFDYGAVPVMTLPKKAISLLVTSIAHQEDENAQQATSDTLGINPKKRIDENEQKDGMTSVSYEIAIDKVDLYGRTDDSVEISTEDQKVIDKAGDIDFVDIEIDTEDYEAGMMTTDYSDAEKIEEREAVLKKVNNSQSDLIKSSTELIKENFSLSIDTRKINNVKTKESNINKKVQEKMDALMQTSGSEKIYTISDVGYPSEDDEPYIQKLPTNAVIPIFVPGAPSSHIGYFVIIDQFGNPIDESYSYVSENHTLGTPYLATMNDISNRDLGASAKKYNILSTVFELTLKKTIEESIKSIGVDAASFPDDKRLYSCLFNRALHKQRVTLLYVPTTHMTYYAYDYRPDGTGKGLMEDSSFIIRMRTSFMIAEVLSALNNATDRHKISFDLGDNKGTNVEQVMGLLKDSFITKYMYNLDHNPMNVMRDIIARSVSIVPKEIGGITNLNLDTETTQGQAGNSKPEVADNLTDMIITSTKVPASIFNALNDAEFSRSVATNNLLFANFIRFLQGITCNKTENIVKGYVRNSYSVLKEIIEVLKENNCDVDTTEKLKLMLDHIVSNIFVTLPSPDISPDKARYAELEEVIKTIDAIAEKLIPDDMIVLEDDKSAETLKAIRASIVVDLVKEAVHKIGAGGIIDTTMFDDDNMDILKLEKYNHIFHNFSAAIAALQNSLKPGAPAEGGETDETTDDDDDDVPSASWESLEEKDDTTE